MPDRGGAGPAELMVVRHGESVANVAFAAADAAGLAETGVTGRDADVPLSDLGRAQAADVGRWLATLPPERGPQVVVCSPYRRAVETTRLALAELPAPLPVRFDERLRDRETGVLELMSRRAVRDRFPDEYHRRARVGELYYRPPGGESLVDVALRLRTLLRDLDLTESGRRLLLVAHDAVVLMLRYVIEELTEDGLRAVITDGPVANGSVTHWVRDGRLRLAAYNRQVCGRGP
jgi:2,3-bisphosphoglycerate-dependent phosphoglycerate mutase